MLVRQTKELQDIPLMSQEQKNKTFDPQTYLTKIAHYFDPKRGECHMNATVFLHALFHTGAVLINKGLAYSTDPKVLSLTADVDAVLKYTDEGIVNRERRHELLSCYYNTETYSNQQRSLTSRNPFHILFVLKVALDHLPAESIIASMEKLLISACEMSITSISINFADGICFANDYAATAVLFNYILNNASRFSQFSESMVMRKIPSYSEDEVHKLLWLYSILGGRGKVNLKEFEIAEEKMHLLLRSNIVEEIKAIAAKEEKPSWFGNFGTFNLTQLFGASQDKAATPDLKP